MIGGRNRAHNWSRPVGGVKRQSLKTQNAIKPSLSPSLLLLSFCSSLFAFATVRRNSHNEKKNLSPSLVTSFYSFTLVYFLSVEFRVLNLSLPTPCLRVRPRAPSKTSTSPQLCNFSRQPMPKTSLQTTTELSTISNLWKIPF